MTEHRVVPLAKRAQHQRVGGRAIKNEEDLARTLEERIKIRSGFGGRRVIAIARHPTAIDRVDRRHRLCADARGIIAGKSILGNHTCNIHFRVWQCLRSPFE